MRAFVSGPILAVAFREECMRTAKIGPDLRLLDFENRPLGLSFLPLPLPSLSFFGSRFIPRAVKAKSPLPRSFLLRNQTETVATQAIHLRGLAEPDTDCSTLSKRSDVFPVIVEVRNLVPRGRDPFGHRQGSG